jgi:hypothetical protein
MKPGTAAFLVGLLVYISTVGCEKKEPDIIEEPKEEEPKALQASDEQSLVQTTFADKTDVGPVSFYAPAAWVSSVMETTRAVPDWITVSPAAGYEAGDYQLSIGMETNKSGADRSAAITIRCGDDAFTINVTQKSTKEDGSEMVTPPVVTPPSIEPSIDAVYEAYEALARMALLTDIALTSTDMPVEAYESIPDWKELRTYTFTPNSKSIRALWNVAYALITRADLVAGTISFAPDDPQDNRRAEALFARAYAYSVLLNYFGGVPIADAYAPLIEILRPPAAEIRNYILDDCEEVCAHATDDLLVHSARQLSARVLLDAKEYDRVQAATAAIISSNDFSLPQDKEEYREGTVDGMGLKAVSLDKASALEIAQGYPADFFTSREYPATEYYPVRYAETVFTAMESAYYRGDFAGFDAFIAGRYPAPATPEERHQALRETWEASLASCGYTFAYLKRFDLFMERLGPEGAKEHHRLLPIPQEEMDKNRLYRQNPGYE